MAKGNGFPKEMISVAERKLAGFNELKSDIDTRMLGVHHTLDGIRQTIKDNIQCDQNESGLLTRSETEYMACLVIKHNELDMLFREDESQWIENLEITKKEAQSIREKIKAFFERENQEF